MPVLLFLAALVAVLLTAAALVPVSLLLRYRRGTARRRARGWVAALNVWTLSASLLFFLGTTAVTSLWIPHALGYSLAGAAAGGVMGGIGLACTRWETHTRDLYYTPHRALVLSITLLVAGRIGYGVWRAWHAWHTTPHDTSWVAASGATGSLAVGAAVLGYYLIYWVGVRRQLARHGR